MWRIILISSVVIICIVVGVVVVNVMQAQYRMSDIRNELSE